MPAKNVRVGPKSTAHAQCEHHQRRQKGRKPKQREPHATRLHTVPKHAHPPTGTPPGSEPHKTPHQRCLRLITPSPQNHSPQQKTNDRIVGCPPPAGRNPSSIQTPPTRELDKVTPPLSQPDTTKFILFSGGIWLWVPHARSTCRLPPYGYHMLETHVD